MQETFLESSASASSEIIISVCSCCMKRRGVDLKLRIDLVLFQAALRHGLVSLLLEGDDDQSHKYVDEEEGEHHEVDHVKDGGLHAEAWVGTLVLVSSIYRVLQDSERVRNRKVEVRKI